MTNEADKLKGKAKQAVGDIIGDEELEAEGKADEAAGEAKDLVDKVADLVHDGIDTVKGAVRKLSS